MDGAELLAFSIIALSGAFLWGIVSYRYPVTTYFAVLGGFLTVQFPLHGTFGPVTVSAVDLLFAIYLFSLSLWLVRSGTVVVLPYERWYLTVVALFVGTVLFAPFVGLIIWSHSPAVLTAGIRYLEWTLFLPVTAVIASRSVRFETKAIRVIAVAVLFHGAVVLAQVSQPGTLPWRREYIMSSGRAVGLLPGPNQLGSFGAVCLLIGLSYLFYGRDDGKMIPIVTVFASGFLILASESRTGLVMAAGSAIILIAAALWERNFLSDIDVTDAGIAAVLLGSLLATTAALGLGGGEITDGLARFSELYMILSSDPSEVSTLASRIRIWRKALAAYARIGWHGSLVPAIFVTTPTHNYYLSMLVQAGPLGLGALLALLVLTIRNGVRRFSVNSDPAAFALIFVTVAIAVGSLTRHPFVDPPIQILFWVIIGMTGASQISEYRSTMDSAVADR